MYLELILPLIAIIVAQGAKFFIKSNHQSMTWKAFMAYSGMPSGHSSFVVSLSTIIALKEGLNSPLFAISFVLAVVVLRDAMGIRNYLGQHGKILNVLVKDLKNDIVLDEKYPKLLERIGHTPLQVLVGSLIGFSISLLGYILI